jgi:hypothetical protein
MRSLAILAALVFWVPIVIFMVIIIKVIQKNE